MRNIRLICLLISFTMVLLGLSTSCRKDAIGEDSVTSKENLNTDSTHANSFVTSPGNYLAVSGLLQIKVNGLTYTFDAGRDSIAFINVSTEGNKKYYGITAVNKEHTMSFGISASGSASFNINTAVAGSQLLLSPDENKKEQEYSLSKFSGQKDFGNINITQYIQGKELAKGTFYTFLALDDKPNTLFYKVEGSFDLQMK